MVVDLSTPKATSLSSVPDRDAYDKLNLCQQVG